MPIRTTTTLWAALPGSGTASSTHSGTGTGEGHLCQIERLGKGHGVTAITSVSAHAGHGRCHLRGQFPSGITQPPGLVVEEAGVGWVASLLGFNGSLVA